MLEAAFAAGLASEGADVVLLGVAPTPEVAWWSATERAPAAMISASHNPFTDNGIKLFSAGGRKLPDAAEAQLEATLARLADDPVPAAPHGRAVGTLEAAVVHDRYGAAVAATLDGRRLDGLRLVVDCANGAASVVAPEVLAGLGAKVEVLNASPNGTNINERCGSTDPEALQEAVVAQGADAGVAFDGDADRTLLVDRTGRLVDGDQIIGICAVDLARRGRLARGTVVVTVMTNLGFRQGMATHGIQVVDTQVGDRYVLEALDAGGFVLGGEQSGHVIFRDLATTGDGLLTAVQVLDVVMRTGTDLGSLADAAMRRLPQVLRNVRLAERDPTLVDRLAPEIAATEADLGNQGRVLVRPSGTEPLLRIMVEAATGEQAEAAAARLVAAVERLGAAPKL
jgi:phosphoglucosamine mutase